MSGGQDAAATPAPQFRAAVVTPLAPECYKLQVTLARETHEKLRRAQALARHTLPSGDVGSILDRALTLLIDDLERRRFARVASPRPRPDESAASGRHIPAAVRRAVWQRDEGHCAFVGRTGRCRETAFLEFHHVVPYAAGGAATADNIHLRCRARTISMRRAFSSGTRSSASDRRCGWSTLHRTTVARVDATTIRVGIGEAAATEESWQQPFAAKRYTFTDYKPFTKDSPLLESGLFGPDAAVGHAALAPHADARFPLTASPEGV
jgi:hypothetical protein